MLYFKEAFQFKVLCSHFFVLVMALCQFTPQLCLAEFSVIVHPTNRSHISAKDIQRAFLGNLKSFHDGKKIMPIDLPINSNIRQSFNRTFLKKDEQQVKSYWARRIFTGKGMPPKELNSLTLVKAYIASHKNAIGYIDTALLDKTVKEIYSF